MHFSQKKLIISLVALAALISLGGSCAKKDSMTIPQPENPQVENSETVSDDRLAVPSKIVVALEAQNGSGQDGTATLADVDGKVRVTIALTGAQPGAEPSHIHAGSCPTPGAVTYPLNPVSQGRSETDVAVSMADLLNQLPLAINVHKSADELGVYVACGDITREGDDDVSAPMPVPGFDTKETEVNDDDSATEDETSSDDNAAANTGTDDSSSTPGAAGSAGETTDAAAIKAFTIEGTNFAFSQKEIRVKKGDTVKVTLNVTDGFHDFVIDEFNAKTKQMNEGGTETIQFVADRVGTFEYYCSVGKHREMGMVGTLVVE